PRVRAGSPRGRRRGGWRPSRSCRLPKNALVRRERLEPVGCRRERDRLPAAEAEDAGGAEAVAEQLDDAVLQRDVEVDEHVAADDEVEVAEGAVGGEVVLGEDDIPQQVGVE